MLFELFSFGCSFNASDSPGLQKSFYHGEITSVPVDELASGVVGELLTFCRAFSKRNGCARVISRTPRLFPMQVLISPLLFTCAAYILIVIVIRVSKATEVEESTIPQQVFCFRSLLKPFVEVLPQPRLRIPERKVPSLWHSLAQDVDEPKMADPVVVGYGQYWAPEPDVEFFDPVVVNINDITWKPMKSLFSYDNWY